MLPLKKVSEKSRRSYRLDFSAQMGDCRAMNPCQYAAVAEFLLFGAGKKTPQDMAGMLQMRQSNGYIFRRETQPIRQIGHRNGTAYLNPSSYYRNERMIAGRCRTPGLSRNFHRICGFCRSPITSAAYRMAENPAILNKRVDPRLRFFRQPAQFAFRKQD
jgi:hypothetical protein